LTGLNLGSSSASRDRPRVLVDTNLLLRAARTGFLLVAELGRLSEGSIPALADPVRRELVRLAREGSRPAELALIQTAAWPRIEGPGAGDDAILALALRHRLRLATADRELAQRATRAGLEVLVPRDRTRLTLRSGRGTGASATVKNRGGHRDSRPNHARRRPPAEPPRRRVR